jgi:hypothetical protein
MGIEISAFASGPEYTANQIILRLIQREPRMLARQGRMPVRWHFGSQNLDHWMPEVPERLKRPPHISAIPISASWMRRASVIVDHFELSATCPRSTGDLPVGHRDLHRVVQAIELSHKARKNW